jgi:hypothetical protein
MTQNLPATPQDQFGFGLPQKSSGYLRFASSDGSYVGDGLFISGKSGECTYGAQRTVIELPHQWAALLGQAQIGFNLFLDSGGRPLQSFGYLADENLDLEALKNAIPTDESKWQFDPKSGKRVDPRKESIKLPLVDLSDGRLYTYMSSAMSHVNAVRRLVRNCLLVQKANPETTATKVPLVEIRTKAVPAQGGTAEIHIAIFEVMDWVEGSAVLHALGKSGNAIAFGVSNQEALDDDLGPELTEENTKPKVKPAKASPRL